MGFFNEHFFSVIMDYGDSYFGLRRQFEPKKCINDGFVAAFGFTMLIDGLEWCGLFVDYCDVLISCLDSHSDGTHSLQRIHW